MITSEKELFERALSRSELFDGLAPETTKKLKWVFKDFKRGNVISEKQDGIDCIGLLVRGSAEVLPSSQSAVSLLTSGSEFGICNVFVREQMPTLLKAKTACRVAFIPKDDFAMLLGEDSVLMYRYVKLCNSKMIYLAGKLRLLSISGCTPRLAFWLKTNQVEGSVKLSLGRDEIAKRLGISRASLFRAFNDLEKAGIITYSNDRIIIIDPEAEIFDFDA